MQAIIVGSGIGGLSAALALRRRGRGDGLRARPELTEVGAGISLWATPCARWITSGPGRPFARSRCRCSRPSSGSATGTRSWPPIRPRRSRRGSGSRPSSPWFTAPSWSPPWPAACQQGLPATGSSAWASKPVASGRWSVQGRLRRRGGRGGRRRRDPLGGPGVVARAGGASVRRLYLLAWVCPRPTSVAPGYVGEWWGRGRRFGITTLPGDRVYWWATKNEPVGGLAGDERGYVTEAFRGWADPVPELIATTLPTECSATISWTARRPPGGRPAGPC